MTILGCFDPVGSWGCGAGEEGRTAWERVCREEVVWGEMGDVGKKQFLLGKKFSASFLSARKICGD